MSRPVLALLALVSLSACGGSGAVAPRSPTQTPQGSAGEQVVYVKATDALRFEPDVITVRAGSPVRFVVMNTGATDHEFYVGDEAAQAKHAAEMAGGAMMHDDPNGFALPAGQTKELTLTFNSPSSLLIGCHVTGHYEGGMKATLTVAG